MTGSRSYASFHRHFIMIQPPSVRVQEYAFGRSREHRQVLINIGSRYAEIRWVDRELS